MDGRKCHDCDHRTKNWKPGEPWCYMFRHQPDWTKCAQKTVKGKKVKPPKVDGWALLASLL